MAPAGRLRPHGIILFDLREFLARKLASLRELGSRRMELADGSW